METISKLVLNEWIGILYNFLFIFRLIKLFYFKIKNQVYCNIGYCSIIRFNVPNFDHAKEKINRYNEVELEGKVIN